MNEPHWVPPVYTTVCVPNYHYYWWSSWIWYDYYVTYYCYQVLVTPGYYTGSNWNDRDITFLLMVY